MQWHRKLTFVGGLLLAISQPAVCSLFSGPNTGLGTSNYQWAFQHNWDVSGLSVVDTPDGFKITGIMTANITDPEPLGALSGITLSSARQLAEGTGFDFSLAVHQTGNLSYTGAINVVQIGTGGFIQMLSGACTAFETNDTGGDYNSSLSQGAFSAGPLPVTCQGDFYSQSSLQLNTTIYYVVNGAGTISIDFGNSLLGEVRLNVDEVPEPSTLWLLSAIIPVALYRRRHQPNCRIRS
ncbi:MAG: PEP-CTERM sorting domain-containing protein [Acidobacteria bacterium]|nr:PEP-CTERM sorting domain-containing protein [Acidobacteriota bacterium]